MSTIGVQVIVLVSNLILARLLYPEIFGVLGMATAITGLISVIQEAGFSSYLIYNKKNDQELIRTAFYLNIGFSLILSLLTFLASDQISELYRNDEVETVIRYISLGLLFSSVGITSRALLMKDRQFKTLMIIDVTTEIVTQICAILLVLAHYELLGVTAKLVIRPFFLSLLTVLVKRHAFWGLPNVRRVKEIFSYSMKVFGTQVFIYVNNNLDFFWVGKLFGSKILGLYAMAYQWSIIARFYIAGSVTKVLFPEISRHQDDKGKVRELYLSVLSRVAFLTLPVCFGLFIISKEFVYLLYGSAWTDSIPIMKVLLLTGAITSVGAVGGAVFQGLGKPQIDMYLNIISFAVSAGIIFIASRNGIIAVVNVMLIKTILFEAVKAMFVNKLILLKQSDFYRKLIQSSAPSVLMLIILTVVNQLVGDLFIPIITMSVYIALGIILYIALAYFFNKAEVLWVYNILAGKLKLPQIGLKKKQVQSFEN
jgi:O-antigen/teichoic acid export membrane protein